MRIQEWFANSSSAAPSDDGTARFVPLRPARSGLSLRWRLASLVAVGLVPLLIFTLGYQYLESRKKVTTTGQQTLALARSMSLLIDEELRLRISALQTLAVSSSAADGDFVGFRALAETVVAQQFPGSNILLLREDGQQLMNTILPLRAPLPVRSDLGSTRQVFATGQPSVSNIFAGGVGSHPVVAIDVPVKRPDGNVAYVLSLNPRLDGFAAVTRIWPCSPQWIISVVDRRGVVVARSPNDGPFVGHEVSQSLLPYLVTESEGIAETTSPDGVPLLSAFSHAGRFGWGVAIAVPVTELRRPALLAAERTLAFGILSAAVSLILAVHVALQIAKPLASPRHLAETMDRDGVLEFSTTGLPETDDVAQALKLVEESRREASHMASILRDGLDTISSGFVIYDDQDRLVICNQSYRNFYPETADRMVPGVRFEDILREGLVRGRFPAAKGCEEEWLAERLRRQRDLLGTIEQRLDDGRWVLVTKSRMMNGYIVGLRVDISALKAAEQALRDREEQLKRAQRLAQMGSDLRDLQTDNVEWSDETYRIFGVSREAVVPSMEYLLQVLHPDDRAKVLTAWEQVAQGTCPAPFEYRIVRPDGTVRYIHRQNELIRDEAGVPRYVSGTVQDITVRREIEFVKEQQHRELERSNADLEEFAHAASHDLKAPLRAIGHLAQWISDDIEVIATPDTMNSLRLLQGRVARLQMLLDGLLAYARVGRSDDAIEAVDVSEVVRDVVGLLAPPPGFVIVCEGQMSAIRTHRGPLQVVLQNLISNGVKHHDRAEGRIGVAMRLVDGVPELRVSDDGPGIPERFHDRIFTIFRTLASRDEVESSGVGLAIVKKKVENNGGKIWVESNPPTRGAAFVFTWSEIRP